MNKDTMKKDGEVGKEFLFLFAGIFSFFIGPFQSLFIAGGVSFILICTCKKYFRNFSMVICSGYGQFIFCGCIFILFTNLVFVILHNTNDISYLKTLGMLSVKVIVIFMIVSCFHVEGKDITYYEKIFVYLFVLQSIIELFAFSNKKIASFILHFNHAYELAERYDGARGLALCGGTGWSLSVVFALIFIFYTKNFILIKKIAIKDVTIGLILLLGVFFAGRSGFLGIITSFLYFLIYKLKISKKIVIVEKFLLYLLIMCFFIVIISYVIADEILINFFNTILPWVFEFFYNKAETGKMSTVSTNILISMWEKKELITNKIFLIGEGYFTDPNYGFYYQRVDIGYLRNIFFWGWSGTLFLYLFFISLFFPKFLREKTNGKILIFIIILTLFILEAKAMVVFSNHITTSMIMFWLLLDKRIELANSKLSCQKITRREEII